MLEVDHLGETIKVNSYAVFNCLRVEKMHLYFLICTNNQVIPTLQEFTYRRSSSMGIGHDVYR